MLKRLILIATLIATLNATVLSATTYYVNSSSGSDSNAGTSAAPWLTLAHSIPLLNAGDTLYCTGTFNENLGSQNYLSFSISGTAASPITISGGTWVAQAANEAYAEFYFSGNYIVLTNINCTGNGATLGNASNPLAQIFAFAGNNCTFTKSSLHDIQAPVVSSGTPGQYIQIWGNNHTFTNMTFYNLNDGTIWRIFGSGNLITHCLFYNCMNNGYSASGNHGDLIQTWSGGGTEVSNTVQFCVITNCGISQGMLADWIASGATANPTLVNNWVYRNNIFEGCSQELQVAMPNFHLYNNIFYNFSSLAIYFFNNVYGEGADTTGDLMYNNVFIAGDSSVQFPYSTASGMVFDYNSWDTSALKNSSAVTFSYFGAHNITNSTASALFVNPSAGDFHLLSTSPLRGAGVNLTTDTSAITTDMDGNPRPATGAWDIGPYQYVTPGPGTNAAINVSPISLAFGSLKTNTSATNLFTVQNVGGGTLSGTASVAAPFSIVGGGTYSLGSNQSQTVSVRYTPSGPTDSQVVTFTGGGGATATVSGSLLAILPGLSFESYAGIITAPFTTNGGYVSQTVLATNVASGGSASYYFNITNAGQYIVEASVLAPNSGSKSFWVNIDAVPVDPTMVWDIYPYSTNWQTVPVSWRGNSTTITNDQYNPNIFSLTSGVHDLIIVGREANVGLGQITIAPYAASRPAPPSPPSDLRVVSVSGP